jgi:rubredoxin
MRRTIATDQTGGPATPRELPGTRRSRWTEETSGLKPAGIPRIGKLGTGPSPPTKGRPSTVAPKVAGSSTTCETRAIDFRSPRAGFGPLMGEGALKRWECTICGFIYDEAAGDTDGGLAPGMRWGDVPHDWQYPDCGTPKSDFKMVEV